MPDLYLSMPAKVSAKNVKNDVKFFWLPLTQIQPFRVLCTLLQDFMHFFRHFYRKGKINGVYVYHNAPLRPRHARE